MVYLALFLLIAVVLLGVIIWKQNQAITSLKEKRKEIVVEEHRMFSFLHGLGESLQSSRTQSEFYQFILNGAIRVVEGTHGVLYLVDKKDQALVPQALTPACPPLTVDLIQAFDPESPEKLHSATKLRSIAVSETDSIHRDCLKQRRGLHLNDLSTHPAFRGLPEPERAKVAVRAMLAPLYFGERDLRVLAVMGGSKESKRFDANDFAVFRSLADQCSLALGTAQLSRQAVAQRRLEEELLNAREVQRILLPRKAPPITGYRIAGDNMAARTVSGDYYDFITLGENHLGIAIADVSGKGLPASLMMAMGRSVLRANAEPWFSPAKALAVVNRILYPDMRQDMFVSMIYLIAKGDTGEIVLARAGHDPPMIYRAKDRTVEDLQSHGLAVGVDEGPVFERHTEDHAFSMEPGDTLLLYTDGVNEAQNAKGDEFGLERLRDVFRQAAPQGADHVIKQLHAEVADFVGDFPQTDDMTLVVLEKT